MLVSYTFTMGTKDIQERLQNALKNSPHRNNVRRISLFGSQLHGNATQESDIDLLIELTKPMSMFQFLRLEKELEKALGKKVDLSTPMSLSKYFRKEILEEAESVFERIV
jgi:uncharacterized protein